MNNIQKANKLKYESHLKRAQGLRSNGNENKANLHEQHAQIHYGFGTMKDMKEFMRKGISKVTNYSNEKSLERYKRSTIILETASDYHVMLTYTPGFGFQAKAMRPGKYDENGKICKLDVILASESTIFTKNPRYESYLRKNEIMPSQTSYYEIHALEMYDDTNSNVAHELLAYTLKFLHSKAFLHEYDAFVLEAMPSLVAATHDIAERRQNFVSSVRDIMQYFVNAGFNQYEQTQLMYTSLNQIVEGFETPKFLKKPTAPNYK